MASSLLLPARSATQMRVTVPISGALTFRVHADHPVDAYLVDTDNRDRWSRSETFRYRGGMPSQRSHVWTGLVPAGTYFLIVQNAGEESASVALEVRMSRAPTNPPGSGFGGEGDLTGTNGYVDTTGV